MDFIYKIAATDANIERAALWIPKTSFLANVNGLRKIIIEDYNPTG